MSPFLTEAPEDIKFEVLEFETQKVDKYNEDYDLQDMIRWGCFDFNRYKAKELGEEIEEFLKDYNYKSIAKRINNFKETRFLLSHKFPLVQPICNEYLDAFQSYIKKN